MTLNDPHGPAFSNKKQKIPFLSDLKIILENTLMLWLCYGYVQVVSPSAAGVYGFRFYQICLAVLQYV